MPAVLLAGVFKPGTIPGGSLWNLMGIHDNFAAWNYSPYLGFLTTISAVTAVIGAGFRPSGNRGSRARMVLLSALLALSLLLALGKNTPVVPFLFRQFPFLTNLRYPAKHWVAINLISLTLVFAYLQPSRRPSEPGLQRVKRTAILSFSLVAFILLALAWKADEAVRLSHMLAEASEHVWTPFTPTLISVILKGVAPTLAALSLLGAMFWLRHRQGTAPSARRVEPWILLPIVVELAAAVPLHINWFSREQSQTQVFSPLKLIKDDYLVRTGQTPVFCVGKAVAQNSFRLKSATNPEDFVGMAFYQRLVAIPQVNTCDQVPLTETYSVLANRQQIMLEDLIHDFPTASRALGCTHLVAIVGKGVQYSKKLQPLFDGVLSGDLGEIGVLELDDPIPSAFVITRATSLRTLNDLASLAPQNLTSQQILEHVEGLPQELANRLTAAHSADPLSPRVKGEHLSTTHWRVSLENPKATGPLIIGVRNSRFAGWHAYQNRNELPTVAAAGGFLAAWVERPELGPIEFQYELFSRSGRTFALPGAESKDQSIPSSSSSPTSVSSPSASRSTATR